MRSTTARSSTVGSAISPKLRRGANAYFHWCPACEEMHILPDSWTFELFVCHYILTAGVLHFCDDCTHSMRGAVPLPDLPEGYRDP